MRKIYVVGAGPGNPDYILEKAKEIVKASDLVIVGKRLQNSFEIRGETLLLDSKFNETFKKVEERLETVNTVTFIVSGDPALFSLSNLIKKRFDRLADIEVIPGISSVSYFYSKLNRSLSGVPVLSFHGRNLNLADLDEIKEAVILLDNQDSLRCLADHFKDSKRVFILGENLSYQDEKITQGQPRDFLNYKQKNLSILIVYNQ